jgi:cytochrome c-type biogenesis protein CcmH
MIRLILLVLMAASPAWADSTMPAQKYAYQQLADPAKERQATDLMATIRCIVCQGQAIIDSDAELAGDMRALIRTRIEGGETPEQIKAWLIERYGSYITYAPPVTPITWPLWIAPLVLLGLGVFLARSRFRKQR